MPASPIAYRPLALAIGLLAAMALAAVNPWAGGVLAAAALIGITWHFLAPLDGKFRSPSGSDLSPLSARDFAEVRRRYQRD